MKTPAQHLVDAWQPDPAEWPVGGIPHVPKAQAERAIEAAQADTERYYQLLLRALRNTKASSA